MKFLMSLMVALATVVITIFACSQLNANQTLRLMNNTAQLSEAVLKEAERRWVVWPDSAAMHVYRLDASESKFIAHAYAGGLLWFKGHDHLIAVKDFGGEAQLTPITVMPASLKISAKAGSMVETSSVFTEQQKQIINKELREIVLQPDQYPDIVFRSTRVTGKATSDNQYELRITGDLTLHGVTRQITIPTKATVTGRELRAIGEFSIDRGDFKVKATSAFHGMVRVRDTIKFTFDIVGHEI